MRILDLCGTTATMGHISLRKILENRNIRKRISPGYERNNLTDDLALFSDFIRQNAGVDTLGGDSKFSAVKRKNLWPTLRKNPEGL
ncbi:hypothetical protein RUM43_004778 [Polyplax serrata]|uniref:Uncharacterized protein n=1 Tax=Polyplax serrata TaxID=468196 RepID=A0AAN8SB80_POLSC